MRILNDYNQFLCSSCRGVMPITVEFCPYCNCHEFYYEQITEMMWKFDFLNPEIFLEEVKIFFDKVNIVPRISWEQFLFYNPLLKKLRKEPDRDINFWKTQGF